MSPFRRLLFFALFLTFDLIMFGAFVRVTDAGLGCPDWPGCYGKATPFGALDAIRAEAAARPLGPVTEFKAWVEMLHRYVAAGLGLIVIALAVMATRAARRGRAADVPPPGATPGVPGAGPGVALAWFTLFWIVLQGAFGAWTVTLKLMPVVVTAHLMGGMILFALLLAQAVRVAGHPPIAPEAARLRTWGAVALAMLFVQIALGGWVSTNYATLACRDFPTCQGSLWPAMDAAGFEPWRPLGRTGDGEALPFAALTAIHYAHRLFAYAVFAAVGTLAWRARRVPGLERVGAGLLAVLALQLATGLTNIFLDWPLAAAVLHTGGATALLGLLLVVSFRARAAALPPDPARAGPRASLARAGA
ncbi:MAG TPA: COX15/CtaA family protein [Burkholderiaceae bacterium]|nr:COX15/CtaA family protein [Burkholderiaceae bacterium]